MNRRDKARARVNGSRSVNEEPNRTPVNVQQVEVPKIQELKTAATYDNIDDANKAIGQPEVLNSLISIDKFIGRSYLSSIDKSTIVPLMKTKNNDGRTVEVFNMPGEPETLPSYRWYRIDKIVYEKNVFFTDKFSMLFSALHAEAAQVALVLEKKNGSTKLYLGARDNNNNAFNISGDTLEAAINGFLTGVRATVTDNKDVKDLTKQYSTPAVACVSGVASLRDDKKEDFVQGLERLINSTVSIPSYTAFFIADSVSETERISIVNAFQQVYRQLSPFAEFQTSLSKSETKNLTDTITEGITNTIGKTIGRTITNGTTCTSTDTTTEGKSVTDGTSSGWSYSESEGSSASFTPFGIGGSDNWNETYAENGGESHSETILTQLSHAVSKGDMHQIADLTQQLVQDAKTKQTAQAKSLGSSESKTLQITTKDLHVKDLMETIEAQIKRLRNAAPFGLWNCATYFVSNSESTSRKIADIYKGTIVGEESGLEIATLNSWDESSPVNQEVVKYLNYGINPRFIVDGQNVSAGTTVSSKELAIHMALPQSSVPGIVVQTRASFGRNVAKYSSLQSKEEDLSADIKEPSIKLGSVVHLGEVDKKNSVNIYINDLSRHTFVTGTTGSGKSNTMYLILSQLKEKGIKFMVVEPAKGEYKHVFGNDEDVTVYSNSPKCGKLLQINPFAFPYESIDLLEHVDRLVEIFNACWPMYAAMPSVLKKSIVSAYEKCGWNLLLSENKYKKANEPVFPTIDDVLSCLKEYINNSEYSDETKGDYKGALETRLSDLDTGLLGMVFSGDPISDEKLFNQNSIIDLSRIGSTETKALIMGFMVMKLNEFRMSEGGMNKKLNHVTILEEAHNLLKRTSTEQSQESANLAGKSVEMISNSIAEMRTYGEGFIIVDQSPSLLDSSAIRNTNTKVVMALPEDSDRKVAGKSMALSEDQIEQIARQNVGEAIVYQNSWEEAVQCKIHEYEYDSNSRYVKNYPIPTIVQRVVRAEVLNFLLYKLVNKEVDFQQVAEFVEKDYMPSSLRMSLLDMLRQYRDKETVLLWDKKYFSKLMAIVSDYLNIDAEVIKIKRLIISIKDIPKYRILFDDLLNNTIQGSIDIRTMYYIEQGYSKTMRPELYEQWKETFKNC